MITLGTTPGTSVRFEEVDEDYQVNHMEAVLSPENQRPVYLFASFARHECYNIDRREGEYTAMPSEEQRSILDSIFYCLQG